MANTSGEINSQSKQDITDRHVPGPGFVSISPASLLAILFILWFKLLYTILFYNDNILQLLLKGYFLVILNLLISLIRSPLAKTTDLRRKGARITW